MPRIVLPPELAAYVQPVPADPAAGRPRCHVCGAVARVDQGSLIDTRGARRRIVCLVNSRHDAWRPGPLPPPPVEVRVRTACRVCERPLPRRRTAYCSDECYRVAHAKAKRLLHAVPARPPRMCRWTDGGR